MNENLGGLLVKDITRSCTWQINFPEFPNDDVAGVGGVPVGGIAWKEIEKNSSMDYTLKEYWVQWQDETIPNKIMGHGQAFLLLSDHGSIVEKIEWNIYGKDRFIEFIQFLENKYKTTCLYAYHLGSKEVMLDRMWCEEDLVPELGYESFTIMQKIKSWFLK